MTAPVLAAAVESYLSFDPDTSANTDVLYRRALGALVDEVGGEVLVDQLDPGRVLDAFQRRWGEAKPNTWNTYRIPIQGLVSYCKRREWIAKDADPLSLVDRRRPKQETSRAINFEDLQALWSRRNVPLREKTLWRMLYETAARAGEVLALDVPDLNLRRKEAWIVGKGGDRQRIAWAAGTARNLARYLRGRRVGPVFLTHRRPRIPMPDQDMCPETGRARLSYDYAARLFKDHSGGGGVDTPPAAPFVAD